MTSKDLKEYAEGHWNDYLTTVADASKSEQGKALVDHPFPLYNFDQISKDIYRIKNPPTSADGLFIKGKEIHLVEFKSGFRQKITKRSFQPEKCACPTYEGVVCGEYGKLLLNNQERIITELISLIRFKAIESYLTIEKQILPRCPEHSENKTARIIFTAVVDENGADGLEAAMAEVAGCEDNSHIADIKKALKRLTNRNDASGVSYLYDEVRVVTAAEFSQYLERINEC